MYFFIKLLCVSFLTLLLLVAELVVEHFTHCLTLLVVAWQTMYRFISLFISCVSLALSHNNSKSLEQKVISINPKYLIHTVQSGHYIHCVLSSKTRDQLRLETASPCCRSTSMQLLDIEFSIFWINNQCPQLLKTFRVKICAFKL